jgi:thiol-disulfide isomerase/thioredoxin
MTLRPLALAVALLAAAGRAAAEDVGAPEEIREGLPAPAFSLRTLNPEASGETWIALDRFVGEEPEDPSARLVVISFFASWCEPCRRELPFLVQLDRTYRERGLRVLGVDIDQEDAGIEAARRMIAAARVAYPVLSDRFNFLARRDLGAQAPLPSVFLVRRDGTLARVERGYAKDAARLLLGDVQAALGIARPARAPAALESPRAR